LGSLIGIFKKGETLLLKTSPPLLLKERGTKGVRLMMYNLNRGRFTQEFSEANQRRGGIKWQQEQ